MDVLGIVAGALVPPLMFFFGIDAFPPYLIGAVFAFFLFGLIRERELKDSSADIAFKGLGIIYIALPLSYLIFLREETNGEWWLLLLLVIIWANDTFAYFTGKSIGRTGLSRISPKKTAEGAFGGLLGGFVVAFLYNKFLSMGLGIGTIAVLSLVIGVVGIIGDIAESLLKRAAGVKDSGTIIPGHGGVLDRIDSLIFPIPLIYYFVVWHVNG